MGLGHKRHQYICSELENKENESQQAILDLSNVVQKPVVSSLGQRLGSLRRSIWNSFLYI